MQQFQDEDQKLFEAIEAYRNGNGDKATLIYESTKKYTYKIVHQEVERFKSQGVLTGDVISITEDVMQDLYLNFFHNIAKFRNEDPKSIFKWISVVSHRMLLDYVDKNKMEVLQFEKDEDYREDNDIWDSSEINDADMESNHELLPEAALEDKEFQQLILDFIQSLPEAQAQTVLLHFRGGMKYQEIADEMGVSLITVKTRMKKAKDSLEEIINKYEKRTGTKLHSVSILPLLWLLYRMSSEETVVPMAVDTAVTSSVVGASGTVASGIGSAVTTGVTKAISTRVLVAIVSATVVIGGGVAVGSQFVEKEPVEEQQISEDIENEVIADEVVENEKNDSLEVNTSETETNPVTEDSTQTENVVPDEDVQLESTETVEENTVTVAAKGTQENPYKIGEKIVITDDIVYLPSVLNSADKFKFEITITEYTPVRDTESAYVESVGLTYSLNIIKATAKMIGDSTESYSQFPVLLALIDSDKTVHFMSNPQAYDGTPMLELYNNVEYNFGFHIPHDAWYDENMAFTYVKLIYYLSDGTAKQVYVELD